MRRARETALTPRAAEAPRPAVVAPAHARRRATAPASLAALVLLSGCGSLAAADLPPVATPDASPPLTAKPAGTLIDAADCEKGACTSPSDARVPGRPTVKADDGRSTLLLNPRTRRLTARGSVRGRIGAGTGPVDLATNGKEVAYVSDVAADGIVVVRLRPTLAVTRRVSLPASGPYALAYDPERGRLWATATQTNELIELAGGARPRELERYPSVRRPVAVGVRDDGTIQVTGADGTVQRVTPRG